jgi:hypothetical protein
VITKKWLEALKDIEETVHEKDLPFVESAGTAYQGSDRARGFASGGGGMNDFLPFPGASGSWGGRPLPLLDKPSRTYPKYFR